MASFFYLKNYFICLKICIQGFLGSLIINPSEPFQSFMVCRDQNFKIQNGGISQFGICIGLFDFENYK